MSPPRPDPPLTGPIDRASGPEAGSDDDSPRPRGTSAFLPIEVRRASDAVLAGLVDGLRRGGYGPGDVLPAERELAIAFRVSRKVVREALDGLRTSGVLSVRRGGAGGTVVESLGGLATILAIVQPEDPQDLRSLLEVRRALESTAARLAAERATDADVRALRKATRDLEALMDRRSDFGEGDLRFHLTLAETSKNRECAELLRQVLNRVWVIREQMPYAYVPPLHAVRGKQAIVAAIECRDPQRAWAAVDADLAATEQVLVGQRLGPARVTP